MGFTSSIAWWILPVVLVTGMLHIQAEYAGVRRRAYLFKPLTTSLIIIFALMIDPPINETYKTLIIGGLLFSLAGDVFLMLPQDRFVAGLVSFLVAHLIYTNAFIFLGGFQWDVIALVPYVLYGMFMVAILWQGLGDLRIPVLLYIVVILIMGWRALGLWRTYPSAGTLSAAVGAAFFIVSDSILAYERFRRPFPAGRALVLSTYYLAQTLIALSIAG